MVSRVGSWLGGEEVMAVWLVNFMWRDYGPKEVEADNPISAVLAAVSRQGAAPEHLEMREGTAGDAYDFWVRRMPNDGAKFSVRWRW